MSFLLLFLFFIGLSLIFVSKIDHPKFSKTTCIVVEEKICKEIDGVVFLYIQYNNCEKINVDKETYNSTNINDKKCITEYTFISLLMYSIGFLMSLVFFSLTILYFQK